MCDNDKPIAAELRVNPLFDDAALPCDAVQAVADIIHYFEEQTNNTANLMLAKGYGTVGDGFTQRSVMGQIHLLSLLRETLDQAISVQQRDVEQEMEEERKKRGAEVMQEDVKRTSRLRLYKTTIIDMPGPEKTPR